MSKKITAQDLSLLDKLLLSLQTSADASIIDGIKMLPALQCRFALLSIAELEFLLLHIEDRAKHEPYSQRSSWESLMAHIKKQVAKKAATESLNGNGISVFVERKKYRGTRISLMLPQGSVCSFWEGQLPFTTAQALKKMARSCEQHPS